jgi:hypothetical protein
MNNDKLFLAVQFSDQQNIIKQEHSSNFHYFSASPEGYIALITKKHY